MARLHKRESPTQTARREIAEVSASSDPVTVAVRRQEYAAEVSPEVPDNARLQSHVEKWDRIRTHVAATWEDSAWGWLKWVEDRAVTYGYPPLDHWWDWHFKEFYASGKLLDLGCVGLRGAKSHSNCYAIVGESLFRPRKLLPGLVGVCPVIAQKRAEADDRLNTLKTLLLACGIADISGKRGANVDEVGGFARASAGNAGGGVLSLRDSQGHEIEFRVSTASISGTAGYTGISGFCDEVDLWGLGESVNPADQVLATLATRYTTQPGAVYHVFSATYPDQRPSCFDALVAKCDTRSQYVARLGEDGAHKDHEERLQLAKSIASEDPLLLAPPDPNSRAIPSWVTNPIVTIEDCYDKSDGNLKAMFQRYGGLPGKREGGVTHGSFLGLGEAMRKVIKGSQGPVWDLSSYDPRSSRYGQTKRRGL
jgi:hypothetical protein